MDSVLSSNITYDNDGNLLNDTFHSYIWLADGHVAQIDTNTITYDANGNKVEENVGGTIYEYVSAFGVTAKMMGTTENATDVDLPGGVQAIYSGGTLQRFRFPDWQGTIRAESNAGTRVFTESLAFAPFGERYAQMGTPFNVDSFTGKPDQIVSDEYDFPAREEHNGQGRWVSPDPMRGTGNKYFYADNNPLSKVDLYGLFTYVEQMDPSFAAWLQSEWNRPDPLLESRGPGSAQTGAAAFEVSEAAYLASVDAAFREAGVSVETPPRLQYAIAVNAQSKGQPAQDAQAAQARSTNNGSTVLEEFGQSVRRANKWYSFVSNWFNHGRELEELGTELRMDKAIASIALQSTFTNPKQPEWIEIFRLEEQNIQGYDFGRLAGKATDLAPLPPGFSDFGNDVFNIWGKKRDENNHQIFQLVEQMADRL